MRGPFLSGPLGSAATLDRLCQLARERPPVVILSALWLAEALARELPVTLLLEPDKVRAGRRALRREGARGGTDGGSLQMVAAGEALPLRPSHAGALLVEGLNEIEDSADAADFLAGLLSSLRPGGRLIALDDTKEPLAEARVAGLFLAAGLVGIAQERPREGALLTIAGPGPRSST